jgi:predicted nucleotidyltransferase
LHLSATQQLPPLSVGDFTGLKKNATLFLAPCLFMKKFIRGICEDVVKRYKPDKNVLGILLFGSVVRNKFDEFSDVDIYILLSEKGKFSRMNYIQNGVRVDIIFNTIEGAKKYLKEERNSLRRNTSHMLAYGVIFFQRGKSLKKLQSIAKKNLTLKTIYEKNEILMHKYSIDDFWGEVQRDIKNNDYVAFGLDSQLLVSNIIELFLKLDGGFLRQPNEMMDTLKKLDKNFSGHVKKFYKASDMQSKKQILSCLVKYIYKKSKGALPKKWALE